MARHWTPEERKRQSELMHRIKPWTRSTGPRTPEGKARAARNAWKHGGRSASLRRVRDLLRRQRAFLAALDRDLRPTERPIRAKDQESGERTIIRHPAPAPPAGYDFSLKCGPFAVKTIRPAGTAPGHPGD